MISSCPCKSGASYQDCCLPLHQGNSVADSPEALMRSRYCAFVMELAPYIYATHSLVTRDNVSVESIEQWNKQCHWCGLEIVTTASDKRANKVEFIAWYKEGEQLKQHHELSLFKSEPLDSLFSQHIELTPAPEAVWYYHSASYPQRQIPLPKRNDPCICSSGKKFKKCCG